MKNEKEATIKVWYVGSGDFLCYDTYYEASYLINDDTIVVNSRKISGGLVTVAYNKEKWIKMEIVEE